MDVAVVDVRMPPAYATEGLVAAIEARRARPGFPVLVLSQYVEPLYARELLASGEGAVGYLLKDRVADIDGFVAAVRQVAAVDDNRRVRAVLAWLEGSGCVTPASEVTPGSRNPHARRRAPDRSGALRRARWGSCR